MNFFKDGSDAWDSTPTQEAFIQNYFKKDEPSSGIVSKRSRKRKKDSLSSGTVSTSLVSNYLKNETSNEMPKQKNSNKKSKLTLNSGLKSNVKGMVDSNVTTKFTKKSSNKNSDFKPSKPVSPKKKMLTHKSSKNSKNISEISMEYSNGINVIDKFPKQDLQNNNSPSKNVKSKKSNKSNKFNFHQSGHSEEVLHSEQQNLKRQKKSKSSKLSKSDEPEDSEDEMLKKKLQKLKKIQLKRNKASQFKNASSDIESNIKAKLLKVAKTVNNPKEYGLNVQESEDSEEEVSQIEGLNLKRRKSEASKLSKLDEPEDSEDEMLLNKLKKRKITIPSKTEIDNSEDGDSQNEMQKIKKKKAKKVKGAETPKSNDNCSEVDDSEDDDVIRNELQNTRMFLKIQKLMKVAPHLNPNFEKNSAAEEDNLSVEEISTEESSSESDEEYDASESEDEEELKNSVKDSSEDSNSEDSSNSGEGDSSESEEGDMGSQDFHQTSEKAIPLETYSTKTSVVKKPSTMLEKARAKMASAKFRFLNEKLYTESGGEAFRYFQENREEFEDYHLGYGQQVSKWPLNPVDVILAELQKMNKTAVIADLGCGDAKIARVLTKRTVHSFDLVAMHKCVTACDVSKVPLRDGSVDVAVFCLSLMGVNLVDYLREAYRILKIGGILKIAEVESRIEDLNLFVKNLNSLGFVLERKNTKNKLFVFLDLKKVKKGKAAKATTITLRPCMYKKR